MPIDYTKVCFVIMPFGKKKVGEKDVDFDFIYDNVFKPAVETVELPEGGKLEPRRTDKDYFSGHISQEMFQYIEYSRFALADISGLNANVFYELGVRHRAHESGTAIFRQESGPPPFDINQIKAFPYEYHPQDRVSAAIETIRRVLAESLVHNRLDSPVMIALLAQQRAEENKQLPDIQPLLVEADNALRVQDWTKALGKLSEAITLRPRDTMVLMKRGIVYRDQGKFAEARADFERVLAISPDYAEAHREKGIAENKLYTKELKRRGLGQTPENERLLEADGVPSGEASLRRAVELKPDDFDALSSLGGVLKRQGRMAEAYAAYDRATDISQGNTYPLLNALTVKAQTEGALALEARHRIMLKRGARSLQEQFKSGVNLPWCAFDLAQVHLFNGETDEFLKYVDEGILACTHKWQPQTFRSTLELLTNAGVNLPGLEQGIASLKDVDGLPD